MQELFTEHDVKSMSMSDGTRAARMRKGWISPYGIWARISPPGPMVSEQPMHFLPFQGPSVIQPTLLTPITVTS